MNKTGIGKGVDYMAKEAGDSRKKLSNEELAVRIQSGIEERENMLKLWQQNQGIIHKIAWKYSAAAEIEDLKQEGYLALCEAVRHYDAGMGVPFLNYAVFWIRLGMQRYSENCCSIVRIPSDIQKLTRKYRKLSRKYREGYGREASDREVRALLDVDAGTFTDIKRIDKIEKVRSLNEPVGGEVGCLLEDMAASTENMEADLVKKMDTEVMERELWAAVGRLPEEQSAVIRYNYKERKTLREIGEMSGTGAEGVRQVRDKALRTLRMPGRCRKFKPYYDEYMRTESRCHVGVRSFQSSWMSEVEREAMRS